MGKQGLERVGTVMRRGGENMNNLGFPEVHEMLFNKPNPKPHRMVICRCWQSLKFPLCDNSHQKLQKLGVRCGPIMLEIKAAPKNVGAEASASTTCCNEPPSSVTS